MRNVLLSVLAILISCTCANATPSFAPNAGGLKLVAQLPAELPQRIKGFAYDGEKLWTAIYHGGGVYAILDPTTLQWTISKESKQHAAIRRVSGAFESPGALCFIDAKLWIAGAYGDSFGSIDTRHWTVERLFKGKQRQDWASQSYSSMAYDGTHLWIAWHWFKYALPTSQTQLLLKIEPETGKVVGEYPLMPGTRNDGTHGLAWDGSSLWHAKDNNLVSMDPSTGLVTSQYLLRQIKRPSGLAWDGSAMWIAEFDGKIWHLPFVAIS